MHPLAGRVIKGTAALRLRGDIVSPLIGTLAPHGNLIFRERPGLILPHTEARLIVLLKFGHVFGPQGVDAIIVVNFLERRGGLTCVAMILSYLSNAAVPEG